MISQRFGDTNLEDRFYRNIDNLNLKCCSRWHKSMFIHDLIVYAWF